MNSFDMFIQCEEFYTEEFEITEELLREMFDKN